MKNIFLLPTDQPSRLFKFANELHLDTIPKDYYKKYNINITSDEEIKDGDYWIYICPINGIDYGDNNKPIVKSNLHKTWFEKLHDKQNYKKIILTTDPKIIEDGVQSIDDEFLEWFVKNSSCEFVEAKLTLNAIFGYNYKIIIPQEEPKQETLNKINNMNEEIKKQINLLEEEQTRVKQFINENNFNCTTAPYVIAKQYRDEIKKHIGILKMNLEN